MISTWYVDGQSRGVHRTTERSEAQEYYDHEGLHVVELYLEIFTC